MKRKKANVAPILKKAEERSRVMTGWFAPLCPWEGHEANPAGNHF